mgnify:CR=1 FL=1
MSDESERVEELFEEIKDLVDDNADLESLAPADAYELWIDQLRERSESTVQTYGYRVEPFIEWLQERGITDLVDLGKRDIKEFEAELRAAEDKRTTRNNKLGTIRLFLRFCEDLNAVSGDVIAAMDVPELTKDDKVDTDSLVSERAFGILDDLATYEYASREHVAFLLLWRTTIRLGALYSLDLQDLYLTDEDIERIRAELTERGYVDEVIERIIDETELPAIRPRSRPETDTRLKNGEGGERWINISRETAQVVQDYIDTNRHDVTDEHGREPLITSQKGDGRLSKSAIRNWCYILTQPCNWGGPCPHEKDPGSCEYREHGQGAGCPSSRSPHKIRKGSITWHRDRGWPIEALTEKANAGEDLIKGVYDQPEEMLRGSSRRSHLNNLDKNTQNDES